MGVVYSKGQPLRKVPTDELVDVLFQEIDKYYAAGKTLVVDEAEAAEGAALLAEIEAANAHDLTPERLAAMEAEQARAEADATETPITPVLDEDASPTAGRRFTRA